MVGIMKNMKNSLKFIAAAAVLLPAFNAADIMAQNTKKTPYWASIDEAKARMRTGPSTEFPIKWVYQRQKLPVKVVAVHSVWRKVEDPDGDQGWMHVRLLSPKRTAMITSGSVVALRASPSETAQISWRAEAGVVGEISDCNRGWCRFDNKGRSGFVEAARLYGEEEL